MLEKEITNHCKVCGLGCCNCEQCIEKKNGEYDICHSCLAIKDNSPGKIKDAS